MRISYIILNPPASTGFKPVYAYTVNDAVYIPATWYLKDFLSAITPSVYVSTLVHNAPSIDADLNRALNQKAIDDDLKTKYGKKKHPTPQMRWLDVPSFCEVLRKISPDYYPVGCTQEKMEQFWRYRVEQQPEKRRKLRVSFARSIDPESRIAIRVLEQTTRLAMERHRQIIHDEYRNSAEFQAYIRETNEQARLRAEEQIRKNGESIYRDAFDVLSRAMMLSKRPRE